MSYYDTFELKCGCRMHCKCDKAMWCPKCEKTQVAKSGVYGVRRCRECHTVIK